MDDPTHYGVLRITQDAPPEVIRAAYKALSQKWHPDRNPSPEAGAIMQAINAAYAVLSDPSRRADYDRSLHAMSNGWAGFDSSQWSADYRGPSTAGAPSGKRRGRAFEVDWDAIARAQHEQDRRYRVFGRDSLLAAAKTLGLMLGTIALLVYLGSHGYFIDGGKS
jgi:curved DNA-binding protein CbpA